MPVLKRQYDSKGNVSHLEVLSETKVGKEWHPSDRVVQAGLAEGWLSIADGKMTLKTGAGKADHVFKSSGTGRSVPSTHYVKSLTLYERVFSTYFAEVVGSGPIAGSLS